MTPKEKANELANKFVFKSVFDMTNEELKEARKTAKQCALIAVDEILKTIMFEPEAYEDRVFWNNVKQEIEKL